MSNKTKAVVVDMYHLRKDGDNHSMDLKMAVKYRDNVVLLRDRAELVNEDAKESGIYYKINEENSEIYMSSKGKKKTAEPKEKKTAEPKDEDLEAAKLEYKKLYEKKPHHSWDLEVINKKIAEFVKD